ncbi:hypothetical protein ACLKA7_007810 [Drosophila subpalustris]
MRSSRSNALDYLDGLAVHWYWDEIFGPNLLDEAHAEMPNKLIWGRGESYMRAYMQDLQHNINGWLDWNLVLDEQGGPNYVHNYVDSPVIVNTTSRRILLHSNSTETQVAAAEVVSENLPVDVALSDAQRGEFKLRLPARSWHTAIYR